MTASEFPRTTYERAVREYDEAFQRHLTGAIVNAIAEASIVTDPDLRIMALRIGETIEALTSCLISFAAMSPHFDTPSHLREFAETTATKARGEGFCSDFVFDARKGGTA